MKKVQYLIIINGFPGSGKTYLGDYLAKKLSLPYVNKDGIKELLFDHLGWQSRGWSKKLGAASFEILFHILETQIKTGLSCIVETAFFPAFHKTRFLEIKNRYQLEIVEIFCIANVDILSQRFTSRVSSGERHPGHVDGDVIENQFKEMITGDKYGNLDMGGSYFEIDTSDFASVDYESLYKKIQTTIDN